MANRQIHELTSKTIATTDALPVQDENGNFEAKKVTVQNVIDAVPADSGKTDLTTFNNYVALNLY